MDQNKKEGLMWLVGPIVALVLGIFLFILYSFVFQKIGQAGDSGLGYVIGVGMLMAVTLFCVLSGVAVLIGIPLGISHLRRARRK